MLTSDNMFKRTVSLVESRSPSLKESVSSLLSDPDVVLQDRRTVVSCVLATLDMEDTDLSPMIHLVWERLNTGHWAQVWPGWRSLYGLLTLARVSQVARLAHKHGHQGDLDLVRDLVKMCDMGLLLGGPDIMGGLLEMIAQEMTEYIATICDNDGCDQDYNVPNKKLKVSSDNYNVDDHALKLTIPLEDIPVLSNPSIPTFVTKCKTAGVVTKLTGCMRDWPGLASWSPARLVRLAGPRTVPVELGTRYTDHDWTQELMTIQQFVTRFMTTDGPSTTVGYLAQHQLLSQVPALRDDILTPDFCFTGDSDQEPDINVWIGPGGTISPAHTDKKHNVLCQVVGYKYVAVFYPDQTDHLYPDPTPMLHNTSQVDLDNVDYDQFPLVKRLRGYQTILGPGDMLYIPPLVWHYVRSLEQSFSVSFWWE